jgi:GNAT superfamily N-acetyltransferase
MATDISLSIRPARASDAGAIAELTRQLGYDVAQPAVEARLSRILAREDQQFLMAELDGRAVGWLHAAIWEDIEAEAFAVIAGLVVDRHHRGHGIGRRLTEQAEAWTTSRGCSVVRLWSSSGRSGAHRFYEELGYTNIKTQYAFVKRLDGAQDRLSELVPRIEP